MKFRAEIIPPEEMCTTSSPRGTRVFLDDIEITGLVDFTLKANGPNGVWTVELVLNVALEEIKPAS